MSLLTPLYLLGALAIAAPVIFHLIRRAPKGEVPFSSLMFLTPTPPRLTRRSRLDDWLLLLLRAAALGLLAFAFARPFLRQAMALDAGDDARERVAVLIDTSASMRRGDVWPRAQALAGEAIGALRPGDELALLTFDGSTRPVMTFTESASLGPGKRHAVARARLKELAPTWGATDLGQALIDAVGLVEDVSDVHEKSGRMPRRVVLITDLQQGSRLDALGSFEWPSDVRLDLRPLRDAGSNAGLQRLDDETDAKGEPAVRVRVSNDPASRREKFSLAWSDAKATPIGKPTDAYVPPGESRVIRVPRPAGAATLRLAGDDHPFDNTLFVADEPKAEATVVYLGDDASDDPSGLHYFLARAFENTPSRTVRVRRASPNDALDLTAEKLPLIVVAAPTPPENTETIGQALSAGATVLCVLRSTDQAATAAALLGVPSLALEEAKPTRDVMLGEIDFGHPLFVPFAGPQFNDFTKIRFWNYRRIDENSLADARIVARFENGDPAVVEKAVGRGRVVLFASGWNPADSQLARSSKFVPLMTTLLDRSRGPAIDAANLFVNAPVPVPTDGAGGTSVRKPDGSMVRLEPTAATFAAAADQPGVYTIESSAGSRPFAVNLDPAESKTSPLDVETLEQFGCKLTNQVAEQEARSPETRRQLLNAELEGRQKLWRWLVVGAIGVLIVETWLAGRTGRSRRADAEVVAT